MIEPSEDTDISLVETLARCSSPVVEDPGGPYLFVDLYPFDLGEHPPWHVALANPLIFGAILKATDGVRYGYTEWFKRNFRELTQLGASRRGTSLFVGGYHYTQFLQSGKAQADFYLQTLRSAGWGSNDIIPIVDVEFGGERSGNRRASTQQIIDCVTELAERLTSETGRRVMLYGRGAMRDRSIASRMGCSVVWNAAYTERMVTNGLVGTLPNGKPAPWKLEDIALWQYGGDGVGDDDVHHLPLELVGFGKVDMSVAIEGAAKPSLRSLERRLL